MKDGNGQNHQYFDQCSHLLLPACQTLPETGKFLVILVLSLKHLVGMP